MLKLTTVIKFIVVISLLVSFSACSTINYYSQAISGHLELMVRERPVDEVIGDSDSSQELKRQLTLAQRARTFASEELQLPDNDSYKTYADLERPHVVWNVVATPAYSVKARQWCYLIVGCLSYRGIFDKQEAIDLADELKQQGMDVSVFGSAAYSTLGYFDDPLLNTMLRHGDTNIIGVIFHELAHQTVYVESDTAYNEAFATAVEQEGLRRWYEQSGQPGEYETYLKKKQYRHEFYRLVIQTREKLDQAFNTPITDEEKAARKQAIYKEFKSLYKQWSAKRNYHGFDTWMQRELNNAHLALVATYQDLVPTFANMLASVEGDMQKFYQLVEAIAEKDKPNRDSILASYSRTKLSSFTE